MASLVYILSRIPLNIVKKKLYLPFHQEQLCTLPMLEYQFNVLHWGASCRNVTILTSVISVHSNEKRLKTRLVPFWVFSWTQILERSHQYCTCFWSNACLSNQLAVWNFLYSSHLLSKVGGIKQIPKACSFEVL